MTKLINILGILFLLLLFKKFYQKSFNFCEKYCNNHIKNNKKIIKFEIKNIKLKAKVFNEMDICIENCEHYYNEDDNKNELELSEDLKNICINKIDINSLSNKEYLKEFAKGNCNPLIIIPGVFGSKLEVEISNCYEFKKNYPKIYNTCDLGQCTDEKPWKLYNLWITDYFSPLSIFSYRQKYIDCFSRFMKALYEFDEKENKFKLVLRKGLKIKVKGLNEENGKDSDCGIDSVQNFVLLNFINKEAKGFINITQTLINMGYKNGLTFQYIPYDFRLGLEDNDLNILFKENLERINKITNKKVILMSHSLGSLNLLNQIKINEKYNIHNKIGNLITITPPFFGSIKSVYTIINLFNDYYFHGFGVRKNDSDIVSKTFKSGYQLIPPNPKLLIDEKWFKWVINRINHEIKQDKESYEKDGANLLPNSTEICYKYSIFDTNKCIYNLQDYFKSILKISFYNKNYYLNNVEELLKKFSKNNKKNIFYEQSKNDLYNYNPKIQHTFIFLNSIQTLNKIIYKRDITKEIDSDEYWIPDEQTFSNGDGSVPSFSVLFKAFKQAYEYKNEPSKGYKPVKILELCSINERINFKENIYDKHDGKHKIFNDNSYNGIDCECEEFSNKQACSHPKIILDRVLLNLISNLIQLDEKIDLNSYFEYLDKFNENDFNKYTSECIQLRHIGYGYNKS